MSGAAPCPDLATAKRRLVMKAALNITVLAVLLVAPGPCFALWGIALVSKERAKERKNKRKKR